MLKKEKDDVLAFNRVSNKNMLCKDCIFRFNDSEKWGNSSKCKQFEFKPLDILFGGTDCASYRKEDK